VSLVEAAVTQTDN